ncbi:hypothetical protein TD95_002112 [Thielaviopsis punctulata]|uniref:DASH complex subunit DAM1 n=1 Tax=Thielaviopsis punctulata TaxID=72032 RepID=A0A0F4Z9N2_9PEZI|nr:hypothetical protein TD95_002112 [Thielaviopsis punctulata]
MADEEKRLRTPRPTTPLRPSSRSSFRDSARISTQDDASFPLNVFEPHFAEFSDAMADLEANLMHFQIMHESLARFSESFASFMTTGGDFIDNPTSSKVSRIATPEPRKSRMPTRGATAGGRGIPRAVSRGVSRGAPSARGGTTRGVARGTARGGARGTTRASGLRAPRARGLR